MSKFLIVHYIFFLLINFYTLRFKLTTDYSITVEPSDHHQNGGRGQGRLKTRHRYIFFLFLYCMTSNIYMQTTYGQQAQHHHRNIQEQWKKGAWDAFVSWTPLYVFFLPFYYYTIRPAETMTMSMTNGHQHHSSSLDQLLTTTITGDERSSGRLRCAR